MRIITYAIVLLSVFFGLQLKSQDNKNSTGFLKQSSTMAERWELGNANNKGLFLITPYKPVYVTAGRRSNNPNEQPTSENPAYSLPFKVPYNNYEAKFQLSFKTKVARSLFWGHGDIWVAFTQKAHWQVYNADLSRPFRELNYEPEAILNFATNYKVLGLKGSMLGASLNHQSNGKILPLSRSWNRVIFHAGFENKHWQIMVRPWIRLPDEDDENPAICDFTGRSETIVVYNTGRHQLAAVAAHSLRFKNAGKGSIQLNWTFPINKHNLHGHLQLFNGYGETLMDYNHRQTCVGLSISLVEW